MIALVISIQKINITLLLSFCSFNVNNKNLRIRNHILTLLLLFFFSRTKLSGQQPQVLNFEFFGELLEIPVGLSFNIPLTASANAQNLVDLNKNLEKSNFSTLVQALLEIKSRQKLNDWIFYQLIRKTAQQISPKAENYYRYTLYKWFLLTRSGYDALLRTGGDKLLFYVRTDENIYNIPCYLKNGRQYVCLNYHDYSSNIDFEKEVFSELPLQTESAINAFSYRITRLPEFKTSDFQEKKIQFSYNREEYDFKIKLNPQVKTLFNNYPVVDYASYFNIPLSQEAHQSLIPVLKKNVKSMSVKNGINYLMHFTRYAFVFKTDTEVFGTEKRLTPEQTLLYDESDCEDRAALFFYLVKEIYNLPMIVLSFPEHVTIAIKLDKPLGKPIVYKGEKFSVCEPTPQKENLKPGQMIPGLSKLPYEIAYVYRPGMQ